MNPIDPTFTTNLGIVVLLLFYLAANLVAWIPNGVMRHQWYSLQETRTDRTFEERSARFPWIVPLMLIQLFIFAGLHLFICIEPEAAALLERPMLPDWESLALCIALPLVWYLLQWMLFRWWGYLFGGGERISILGHVYHAVHILAGTPSMLVVLAEMIGLVDTTTATVLLSLTFIMTQIVFIFSGIKIFYDGIGSLLFIFVYLCALEIAPLIMLWQLI